MLDVRLQLSLRSDGTHPACLLIKTLLDPKNLPQGPNLASATSSSGDPSIVAQSAGDVAHRSREMKSTEFPQGHEPTLYQHLQANSQMHGQAMAFLATEIDNLFSQQRPQVGKMVVLLKALPWLLVPMDEP